MNMDEIKNTIETMNEVPQKATSNQKQKNLNLTAEIKQTLKARKNIFFKRGNQKPINLCSSIS